MAERKSTRGKLSIVTWDEFQEGIAPLWKVIPSTIPIFNNPYSIIQYDESVWHTDIIYFPAKYVVDGKTVGYISIYNLSDMHIRPRGIYILPEYRGQGLGHEMQTAAWDLFPKSFYRAFIWSREENVERFSQHLNMKIVPGGSNVWSEFSKLYMFFMYADRDQYPTDEQIQNNKQFIKDNFAQYSLGGINNLNVSWSVTQWSKYFKEHQGNYIDLGLNLNF
jgi:GNAT superfamily N-acetyltransferase